MQKSRMRTKMPETGRERDAEEIEWLKSLKRGSKGKRVSGAGTFGKHWGG